MLRRAAVKVSLREPRQKLLDMIAFLKNFGTVEVHLIHVRTKTHYKDHESLEEAMEALREEAEGLGFVAHAHIRTGFAPLLLLEVAREVRADYVSICWTPKALLRQALLGSIDSDILRMSNLPLFIYSPRIFKSVLELESVLYATDFQHTDAVVMPYLRDSRFKAHTLYLLHVGERAPDPATERERKQHALDNLERLADECRHAYDEVEAVETIGMVRRQIVKQARLKGVELIVVGKSEKPGTVSRTLGSIGEILPHKTSCNVFIIPAVCALDDADGEG